MKFYPKKQLSEKWLKAAVLGSLWATVEIVLGSLLHNLKLPFAGSVLSFITVYLVMAFFRIWPVNGMIWRAGLICALMKSISPSAMVLGPMIGIFSQAIILDLTIRVLGKNNFSYILGGALAVFSALAQKAITLLILYGWDFVVLLDNMYAFTIRQTGFHSTHPGYLLLGLSGVYLASGAIAALMGNQAGRNFLQSSSNESLIQQFKQVAQSDLFRHTRKNNHSIILLVAAVFLLIGGMITISHAKPWISATMVILIITAGFVNYPVNMQFLKKPALWVQLLIIIVLTALFKSGLSQILHWEGMIPGLQMSMRALLVLSCFAIISVELKNPVLRNLLYNKGFQNLYQSMELAFSALPGIMNEFYDRSQGVKGFRRFTFAMLNRSWTMLNSFKRLEGNRPDVFIVTGDIHQGKTTFTRQMVDILRSQAMLINGIFTIGNTNNNNRSSYVIMDITKGTESALCSTKPDKNRLQYGRFYFNKETIALGCNILINSMGGYTDLVVVDEVGPLEINDQGWAPAIEKLVAHNKSVQLWVVRERLLKPIMRKWNVGDITVINIIEDNPEDAALMIAQRIRKNTAESAACES